MKQYVDTYAMDNEKHKFLIKENIQRLKGFEQKARDLERERWEFELEQLRKRKNERKAIYYRNLKETTRELKRGRSSSPERNSRADEIPIEYRPFPELKDGQKLQRKVENPNENQIPEVGHNIQPIKVKQFALENSLHEANSDYPGINRSFNQNDPSPKRIDIQSENKAADGLDHSSSPNKMRSSRSKSLTRSKVPEEISFREDMVDMGNEEPIPEDFEIDTSPSPEKKPRKFQPQKRVKTPPKREFPKFTKKNTKETNPQTQSTLSAKDHFSKYNETSRRSLEKANLRKSKERAEVYQALDEMDKKLGRVDSSDEENQYFDWADSVKDDDFYHDMSKETGLPPQRKIHIPDKASTTTFETFGGTDEADLPEEMKPVAQYTQFNPNGIVTMDPPRDPDEVTGETEPSKPKDFHHEDSSPKIMSQSGTSNMVSSIANQPNLTPAMVYKGGTKQGKPVVITTNIHPHKQPTPPSASYKKETPSMIFPQQTSSSNMNPLANLNHGTPSQSYTSFNKTNTIMQKSVEPFKPQKMTPLPQSDSNDQLREELKRLNEQEAELQREIMILHKSQKHWVNEIEQKYNINANPSNAEEIRQKYRGAQQNNLSRIEENSKEVLQSSPSNFRQLRNQGREQPRPQENGYDDMYVGSAFITQGGDLPIQSFYPPISQKPNSLVVYQPVLNPVKPNQSNQLPVIPSKQPSANSKSKSQRAMHNPTLPQSKPSIANENYYGNQNLRQSMPIQQNEFPPDPQFVGNQGYVPQQNMMYYSQAYQNGLGQVNGYQNPRQYLPQYQSQNPPLNIPSNRHISPAQKCPQVSPQSGYIHPPGVYQNVQQIQVKSFNPANLDLSSQQTTQNISVQYQGNNLSHTPPFENPTERANNQHFNGPQPFKPYTKAIHQALQMKQPSQSPTRTGANGPAKFSKKPTKQKTFDQSSYGGYPQENFLAVHQDYHKRNLVKSEDSHNYTSKPSNYQLTSSQAYSQIETFDQQSNQGSHLDNSFSKGKGYAARQALKKQLAQRLQQIQSPPKKDKSRIEVYNDDEGNAMIKSSSADLRALLVADDDDDYY